MKWFAIGLGILITVTTLHAQTKPTSHPVELKIALAGDSTVTDNAGWGGAFAKFFDERVQITNISKGGRSSSSFIQEGRWQQILDLKPDYVLIQFGHNDQPGHGERENPADGSYRTWITQYVDQARANNIKPILVTPLSRREWDDQTGHINSKLKPWADTVKAIAKEKVVPLIDLHDRSIEFYESFGKEGCIVFSPPKKDKEGNDAWDGTHLNEIGGFMFGELMSYEVAQAVPQIGQYRQWNVKPPAAATQPSTQISTTKPTPAKVEPATPKGAKTIVVADDGSGEYRTIQEALKNVQDNNSDRTTIQIKPGVYHGQIVVEKSKQNVIFVGVNNETCILTYALNVHDPLPPRENPRYHGYGVVTEGDGFIADNLTIRNTSGDHGQAIALRVIGDKSIIRNCKLLGWQDTLRTDKKRHYFVNNYIEGRVDFIYADGIAVFQDCVIKSKNGGFVTAASTPENEKFGYVFFDCKLVSDDNVPAFLGRPWRDFATTAFINCEMGAHIKPDGWDHWGSEQKKKTSRYSEYKSTGPGANPDARVKWSRQLTDEEAATYTIENIFRDWDPRK